ncbi:hypothetical protein BC332_18364 [Capsicum chinense]|nr:hypothetical protein BC332_18364 [Capsicum chinense]
MRDRRKSSKRESQVPLLVGLQRLIDQLHQSRSRILMEMQQQGQQPMTPKIDPFQEYGSFYDRTPMFYESEKALCPHSPSLTSLGSRLRNLGNSILIKELTKGMSKRRSLLDVVQLVETLGTTGVRSPQVSILWRAVKHIWQGPREIPLLHSSGRSKVPSDIQQVVSRLGTHTPTLSLYTPIGQKVAGEGEGYWNLVTLLLSFRLRLLDKTTYSIRLVSYLFRFQARVALKEELSRTEHKEQQSLLIVPPLGERQERDMLYLTVSVNLISGLLFTLSAYWISRYSLSYRLLIELIGNGREGNR